MQQSGSLKKLKVNYMTYIYPDYYSKFKCIAEKCKHNCCIGWEIDIDEDTYDYYSRVKGNFGSALSLGIDHENRCFKLGEGERCAFLNRDGLCEIILKLGEEALCDICNEHPRFYNCYEDIEEVGVGLCCEEACRIILSGGQTSFIAEGGILPDSEKYRCIDILQDRNMPLKKEKELAGLDFTGTLAFYRELERLDDSWDGYLDKGVKYSGEFKLPEDIARQLAVYFMYRHGNLNFASHAVGFIEALCDSSGMTSFDEICEICRMYSCEIEYSDENIDRLLHCIPS